MEWMSCIMLLWINLCKAIHDNLSVSLFAGIANSEEQGYYFRRNTIAIYPHDEGGENVIIFITTLVFTLTACLGGLWLLRDTELDAPERRSRGTRALGWDQYTSTMDVATHILGFEYGANNVYARYLMALVLKSEYFSIFRWRCAPSYATTTDLFEKWLILSGYCLNYMLAHAIMVWATLHADLNLCEDHKTVASCNRSSPNTFTRCDWISDRGGGGHCGQKPPLDSMWVVFVLTVIAAAAVTPLNFLWRAACHCTIHAFMKPVHNSLPHSDADLDAAASPSKYSTDDNDESSFIEGNESVDGEVAYILSKAKTLVVAHSQEEEVVAKHRSNMKKALHLNDAGDIYSSYRFPFIPDPMSRLAAKVRKARQEADETVKTMELFPDNEIKNVFLIGKFLIYCLPNPSKYYAQQYFHSTSNEFISRLKIGGVVYTCAPYLIPPYVMLSLLLIVCLGFNWYQQRTTVTWACFVAINLAFDSVVYVPARVYWRHIVIPSLFMSELRNIHSAVVAHHAKGVHSDELHMGYYEPQLELIQHFNPVCRIAKSFVFQSAISDHFRVCRDCDLSAALTNEAAGWRRLLASLPSAMLHKLLSILYWCIPSIMLDIILDWIILGSCVLFVLAIYYGVLFAPFLLLAAVAVLAVALAIREMAIYHRAAKTDPENSTKVRAILRALQDSGNMADTMIDYVDSEIVRKALLSDHYTPATTTEVKARKTPKKRENSSKATSDKNIKTLQTHTSLPSVRAPRVVEDLKPATTSAVPQSEEDMSVSDCGKDSLEKVQIAAKDYHVLAEAIIQYLSSQEEEARRHRREYAGCKLKYVVGSIVHKSVSAGAPKDLVKKHRRIVQKIIKRMVEKDESIFITNQKDSSVAGDRLLRANPGKLPKVRSRQKIYNY